MLISPLDAPALFLLGAFVGIAYRYRLRRHNPDWFVVLGVLATAIAWCNLGLVALIGTAPWGVAPVVETGSLVLALVYPLAYPLWFWLGGRAVFFLVGRRPAEGGVVWLYRVDDKTDSFDPPWDS